LGFCVFGQLTWWPQLAQNPWTEVQWDQWRAQSLLHLGDIEEMDITAAYSMICKKIMLRMAYCLLVAKDSIVPSLPFLKPSRPGELCQSSGTYPTKMVHTAAQKTKPTMDFMQEVPLSMEEKVFEEGFLGPPGHCGFKEVLMNCHSPFHQYQVSTAMAIFRDFQANFRKLEPRHQRHRHELLSAYFHEHQDKLFAMMKPEGKAQLQHSADERSSSILAISEDQQNIHIADELVVLEHDTCKFRLKFVKWMAQLYIFRKRFCFNPQSPSL